MDSSFPTGPFHFRDSVCTTSPTCVMTQEKRIWWAESKTLPCQVLEPGISDSAKGSLESGQIVKPGIVDYLLGLVTGSVVLESSIEKSETHEEDDKNQTV